MSIKIEIRDGKWRMSIENESWEFDNQADMIKELNNLLTLKNTHGRYIETQLRERGRIKLLSDNKSL